MAQRNHPPASSSSAQDARKEQILTQHEPAKIRQTTASVVLKQGSHFLLTSEDGDIPWQLPHGLGLFYKDCRFLDGYTLTLNGCQPIMLSSSDRHRNNTIAVRCERLMHGGVAPPARSRTHCGTCSGCMPMHAST